MVSLSQCGPSQCCGKCVAFSKLNGHCRRHAPLAVAARDAEGKVISVGMWPAVSETGWCCEFIPISLELGK